MKSYTFIFTAFMLTACGQGPVLVTKPTPCTVTAVSGGSQVACPDGTTSFIASGLAGAPGISGSDGRDGTNGTNGQDATPITMVQFCDNSFTPTYPSVFPEFGLCVGGKMYGVYSTNGGFWALLPPGTYSSDGVNASCTFTIADDCGVTR